MFRIELMIFVILITQPLLVLVI